MKKTLIVVAVIILGSLGYYAYQEKAATLPKSEATTDSPSANKVYKNEEFGFSLEYPDYFTTYETRKFDRTDQKFLVEFFEISQKQDDGNFKGFPKFIVSILENESKEDLSSWSEKHLDQIFIQNKSNLKAGNYEWYRFSEQGEVDHWSYLIENKDQVILIAIPKVDNPMGIALYAHLFESFNLF